MTEERIYLYPRWIRLWHWTNAVFCLFLIVTGFSMQFSNPKVPLMRFDLAVSIHNIVGISLVISYLVFLVGNIYSHNGRYYMIHLRTFVKRLLKQFRYYTHGMFVGAPAPFAITKRNKFNPLQQFSYFVIMYLMVPVIAVSGLALFYPDVIPTIVLGVSGLHLTDLFHIIAGFIISIFLLIHVYFCTIGKTATSNFRSMINGYHESH